jgi:hypothetical protein
VLEQREVEAPYHADNGLRLVDTPPDEEAGVVAVGPAPQHLALAQVVVLGDPVLELPEQPAREQAKRPSPKNHSSPSTFMIPLARGMVRGSSSS